MSRIAEHRWIGRARVMIASLLVSIALVAFPSDKADAPVESWVLVNTATLTLTVMQGDRPQMTLHNLAVGRFGTSSEKQQGDNRTPLGRFRVTGIERDTRFYRFIRLSYPDAARAERARRRGDISQDQWESILAAHRRGALPPQDTALGGHIGIHGLGGGDAALHEVVNWTKGCVALTDRQVDSLLPWIEVGTIVEIR